MRVERKFFFDSTSAGEPGVDEGVDGGLGGKRLARCSHNSPSAASHAFRKSYTSWIVIPLTLLKSGLQHGIVLLVAMLHKLPGWSRIVY